MELDIQRFLDNPDQQQFEFQHFPTSYLRLAAHRVSYLYGLQTLVQDGSLDGQGNRIVVRKTAESKCPTIQLSEIPAKQSESDKPEQIKIVIRPRPNKANMNENSGAGMKRSPVRSVEERKEEYDRARARIFSSTSRLDLGDTSFQVPTDGKNASCSKDENESFRNSMIDPEKNLNINDICTSSRVAIFRDREKDRTDPDYDRSYERYVRSLPANQRFNLAPFNMQKFQPQFLQYEVGLSQMPRTQASISYGAPSSPAMSPFCAMGLSQTSREATYIQWPSAAMMYPHPYDQFRQAIIQAPFCQQPLSCDHTQYH